MINLLPGDAKKEIRSARINVVLTRYIIVILFASGFLVLLLTGSYVVLTQAKAGNELLIDASDTRAEVYSSTKAQVDSLSGSLSQAKTILDQEILYSNVLINIGQLMPTGTVLEKIELSAESFTGTPVSMKAYAKTNNDAVVLRERFQSSPIFSNVNFTSISDSAGISGYPVSIAMTVTITKAATQ